jgi:HrpA-like RNA helicase
MELFSQFFSQTPLKIVPLFAALPPESQQLAFQREPDTRKVILSTNIAETAITIEGVRFVVDCGFVKQKFFDERRAIETLAILPVSKASASQRAGRAGRTEKGKCYRLYTAESLDDLAAFNEPVSLLGDFEKRPDGSGPQPQVDGHRSAGELPVH